MSFDWWTLAFQTVNFLVLVWLLQRFLYRPVRRVIAERRELAGRALAEAEAARQAAEREAAALDDERRALAREREQVLAEAHAQAAAERKAALAAADREVAERRDAGRAALAGERQAALAAMKDQALELAGELAARLLHGMAGPDGLAEAALDRIAVTLEAMPEAERARLRQSLAAGPAGGGEALQLVTAAPLPQALQARWRARFAELLGAEAMLHFVVDLPEEIELDQLEQGFHLRTPLCG